MSDDARGKPPLNILLVGHACLPEAGSELGITWNWAWHLAARNRVWVVTHGSFRPGIERYLRDHPRPNLAFIWVGPLGWWDPWGAISQRWIRPHYWLWQRAVTAAAREFLAAQPIDVVHHVSWSTLSAPPLLWKLGRPFVWGPVGGGQTAPLRFLGYFGGAGLLAEAVRTLRVRAMPAMPGLRRTVARADALFAANRETAAVLRRAGAGPVPLFADVGVPTAILPPRPPQRGEGGNFIVLWAGRIEHRKGLPLCLEVARLARTDRIRFLIVGDGPQRRHCEAYAGRLGLGDRVSFLGQLSWPGLQEVIAEAHLFLFTSLRDTLGAVVLEATAKGCPVLCLDHNGVGAHLPEAAAVKVGLGAPRRVAAALAEAIDGLAADPQRRRAMAQAAFDFARSQRWDDRAARMEECYREVLERRARAPAPAPTRRSAAEWGVS